MKRRQTGRELLEQIHSDPEFAAREAASLTPNQRAREAEYRAAEAPLIADLLEVGIRVESAWDLVNTSRPYAAALPILIEHISRSYPPRVREGIIRALCVRDALPFWPALRAAFEAESDPALKFALGCALAGAADKTVFQDVLAIVRDWRHGRGRAPLLFVLQRLRSKNSEANATLQALLADDELRRDAAKALKGKMGR